MWYGNLKAEKFTAWTRQFAWLSMRPTAPIIAAENGCEPMNPRVSGAPPKYVYQVKFPETSDSLSGSFVGNAKEQVDR